MDVFTGMIDLDICILHRFFRFLATVSGFAQDMLISRSPLSFKFPVRCSTAEH